MQRFPLEFTSCSVGVFGFSLQFYRGTSLFFSKEYGHINMELVPKNLFLNDLDGEMTGIMLSDFSTI